MRIIQNESDFYEEMVCFLSNANFTNRRILFPQKLFAELKNDTKHRKGGGNNNSVTHNFFKQGTLVKNVNSWVVKMEIKKNNVTYFNPLPSLFQLPNPMLIGNFSHPFHPLVY